MDISARNDDGRIVLESEEKNHTIFNLLRSELWETGTEAGYNKGHPYIGESELVFDADEPETAVTEATEHLKDSIEAFREAFSE